MNTHMRMAGLAAAVGLLLVMGPGCSTKAVQTASDSESGEPAVSKEPPVSEQDLLAKSPSGSGPAGGSKEIQVAKVAPSDAARRHAEEVKKERAASALAGLQDVFFGFDSWNLSEDGKQALEADAQWLQSNPDKVVTIEGHCDERGTQAYNLVLGEKRAKAVRNYLVELGVGSGRLTVTSYGKERPFCNGHDESCYQQNRRGHIGLRVR